MCAVCCMEEDYSAPVTRILDKTFNVFLINTEMCMSWLLLILIVSMHGSAMK